MCDTELTSTTPLSRTSTIHHPPDTNPLVTRNASRGVLLSPPLYACHQPLRRSNRERRGFSCQHHCSPTAQGRSKGGQWAHNNGWVYKVRSQFLSVSLHLTNPHYNTETPPPFGGISSACQHPSVVQNARRAGHHLPLPTNTPVARNASRAGFLATTSLPANTLRRSKCERSGLTTSLLTNTLLTHILMPGRGLTPPPPHSSPTRRQKVRSPPFRRHDT